MPWRSPSTGSDLAAPSTAVGTAATTSWFPSNETIGEPSASAGGTEGFASRRIARPFRYEEWRSAASSSATSPGKTCPIRWSAGKRSAAIRRLRPRSEQSVTPNHSQRSVDERQHQGDERLILRLDRRPVELVVRKRFRVEPHQGVGPADEHLQHRQIVGPWIGARIGVGLRAPVARNRRQVATSVMTSVSVGSHRRS
jgi:hypothetical protein